MPDAPTRITFTELRRLLRNPEAREAAGVVVLYCGVDQGNVQQAGRVVIDGVDLGYYGRGDPLPILPHQRRENGLDFQEARIAVTIGAVRVLWVERTAGRLWATVDNDEIGAMIVFPETELGVEWNGR